MRASGISSSRSRFAGADASGRARELDPLPELWRPCRPVLARHCWRADEVYGGSRVCRASGVSSVGRKPAPLVPSTKSMGSEPWLTISTWPLIQYAPLVLLGCLLLRHPVRMMIGVERPVLRRFVTVIAALVACRLLLSLPS